LSYVSNCIDYVGPRSLRLRAYDIIPGAKDSWESQLRFLNSNTPTMLSLVRQILLYHRVPCFIFDFGRPRIYVLGDLPFDSFEFGFHGRFVLRNRGEVEVDVGDFLESFRRNLTAFVDTSLFTFLNNLPFKGIWLNKQYEESISDGFSILGFDCVDVSTYVDLLSENRIVVRFCTHVRRRLFLGYSRSVVSLENLLGEFLEIGFYESCLDVPFVRDYLFRLHFVRDVKAGSPKTFVIDSLGMPIRSYYEVVKPSLLGFVDSSSFVVGVIRFRMLGDSSFDSSVWYYPASLLYPSMHRVYYKYWVGLLGLDGQAAKDAYNLIVEKGRRRGYELMGIRYLRNVSQKFSWFLEPLGFEVRSDE